MSTAVTRETAIIPSQGEAARNGQRMAPTIPPKTTLRTCTRLTYVSQPLEPLLDLFFGVGLFDLGDLLLEAMGDEFLDRGVAGHLGVLLDLGEEGRIELDFGAGHGGSPYGRDG